jgi:hypothetical protein
MVLEVADDPHAAVDEQQHARLTGHLLRLHDVDLHGLTILRDGLFGCAHPGHIDRRLVLQRGQDLLRFRLGEFPERARVLVDLSQKGANLRVDSRVGGRVRRRRGGLRHEGCSEGQCCE